jgi:hypothetical protein
VKGPRPQEIKGLPGLLFRERPRASSKEAKSGQKSQAQANIIKRTMPKPRFSPKMKHDSCHYQYVGSTNGNKCPVRVLVFRQLERQCVPSSLARDGNG